MFTNKLFEVAYKASRSPLDFWDDAVKSIFGTSDYWLTFSDEAENQVYHNLSVAELNTWVCTDTKVGLYAYFFRGDVVAFSYQPARKSEKKYWWVSTNARCAVVDFLEGLVEVDDESKYLCEDVSKKLLEFCKEA